MNIKNVDINKILPPVFDSRTKENPEADEELKNSIQQFGVLEPILVKPKNKQYEIVFGHRRYRMSTRLGLPTMPCIIMSAGDKETELMKIHENLHRLPNSHIDQGRTFQYLRDTFNMSETEMAALVNKSVPYVSQHLTLLDTDQEIIDAVHEEKITFSSARELVQVKHPSERKRLFNIVRDNGASVDVLHGWVGQANNAAAQGITDHEYSQDISPSPQFHNPTFPCQSCDRVTPIAQMQIIRLCRDCDQSFRQAVEMLKKEAVEQK